MLTFRFYPFSLRQTPMLPHEERVGSVLGKECSSDCRAKRPTLCAGLPRNPESPASSRSRKEIGQLFSYRRQRISLRESQSCLPRLAISALCSNAAFGWRASQLFPIGKD